ncbi:MAG TPA: DUF2127 domain-containing protein [Verrucomicrobiae bacterium]|nr:DUF2127 domain-containing protein [Verrucomicrobiae bacterium]
MTNGEPRRGKTLHWLFEIGIWFKGIDGILELIGGVLFLVFSPQAINHFIVLITQHELQEDPGDWICNMLRRAGQHLWGHGQFIGGIYLLCHGAIKVFLVAGILRGRLWYFPTAMVVLGIFIAVQAGRLGFKFSWPLLIATGIDTVIVFLIWREYRRLKAKSQR